MALGLLSQVSEQFEWGPALATAVTAEVLVNPDDWLRGISAGLSAAGVALDRFNRVEFDPIRTDAIRIEVALQPEYSGGMLECRLGIEGE